MAGERSSDDIGDLHDESAVRRLLVQYCQYLDDGRFDDWIDLFANDIVFVVMDTRHHGRDAVRGFIEASQQDDARGLHTISEPLITIGVDGDTGKATATTDFVWFSRAGETGRLGRYHDTLVRDPDRWRFSTREIVFAGDSPIGPSD